MPSETKLRRYGLQEKKNENEISIPGGGVDNQSPSN
jgi:hypothetical protein